MREAAARAWRRLRVLLRWRAHNAELREEMALHLTLKQEALERSGLTPSAARAAARRAMGDMTGTHEDTRSVWVVRWLSTVWQDVAYGLRAIRRDPLFNAIAVLGLAGGLGFSAAAFSAFNAFALRGWNVREPNQLVALYATAPGASDNRRAAGFSIDQVTAFAARARTLDGVAAFERTRPDGTGRITAAPVGAGYFSLLGVPMYRGRSFTPIEDRVGAPARVLVLSHDYWRDVLHSADSAMGSTVRVHGIGFTVIGVAAPGFSGTDVSGVDAWIPLSAMLLVEPRDRLSTTALSHADQCCVQVVARLAPGATHESVTSELTALLEQSRRPGVDTIARAVTMRPFTVVGSAGPDASREVAPVFLLIAGGVAVVLLLACANVANLLLARASTRQREITIRLSLGASRARIVRQLMTESVLLALIAGVPALVIARWLPQWILSLLTSDRTTLQFTPDARVLTLTFGLTLVSAVAFGLAPALHATQTLVVQRTRTTLRTVFLSTQVAFCLVLLVAAGLFYRSARVARSHDLGFASDSVTALRLEAPANDDAAVRGRALSTALPAAALRVNTRLVAYTENSPLAVDNATVRLAGVDPAISLPLISASPEYFDVMRMRMLAGHAYAAAAREVVINALLAARLGGATRAIGASITINGTVHTVVGVVANARDLGLRDARDGVYVPFTWAAAPYVLVRGSTEDASRLSREIATHDASTEVSMRTYDWYVENALSTTTAAAAMAGALGVLALALAFVGMFGVFTYWVRQRQHDIAICLALGATRARIVRMVLGASGRAVGWGLLIGLAGAVASAMVLRRSLYGLEPLDPAAFGAAIGTLLLSALVATALPVVRAVRVTPMELLRAD